MTLQAQGRCCKLPYTVSHVRQTFTKDVPNVRGSSGTAGCRSDDQVQGLSYSRINKRAKRVTLHV